MTLIFVFAIPIFTGVAWFVVAKLVSSTCRYPRQKRICLLTSHCDDEAMFFSPTVIRLTDPRLQNHLELLCLSNGENPRLRATRQEELYRSADNLGIRPPDRITCLDDEESFPDSMTIYWSPEKVAGALTKKFPSAEDPIDMIITFDHRGISSHANHISLLAGARHWLQALPSDRSNKIGLYSLVTTSLVRKYTSIFDAPATLLLYLMQRGGRSTATATDSLPERMVFFSGWSAYRTAQRSMTECHRSQMLWFRYGWIGLSRYMSLNDLVRQA